MLRLPTLPAYLNRTRILVAAAVVVLVLVGLLAWFGYSRFHWFHSNVVQDKSTVEIRAMKGIVATVQKDGFTFFPDDTATIAPDFTNPRTVVFATSTTFLQKGARKDPDAYTKEAKAYQAQVTAMDKGDETAKAYVLSHAYPDMYLYTSVNRSAIKTGQEVIVLTTIDVRRSGYVPATEVRIEGTPSHANDAVTATSTAYIGEPKTALGKGYQDIFGRVAFFLISETQKVKAADGQHQGNLYWSGNWTADQFGCDAGYWLVPHHYIDGSTNNAGWYTCVGNNAPTNQLPQGYQDGTDNSACTASGWAWDPDVPSTAIRVDFYADGSTYIGSTYAGTYRGDLSAYGYYHGYTFSIPASYKNGQSHSIDAYGIDSAGGTNARLGNSPKYFQCAAANNPPTNPTISGPTSLTTGQWATYSFYSYDPDGDAVGYGVDWNLDGAADNWIGYPNSSIGHSWSSAGTYTFQALAQDAKGANSGWTRYTVTVSDPAQDCSINLAISPASGASGSYRSLSWTSSGVTSGPWATFNNGNAVSTSNPGWGVTPAVTTYYSMSAYGSNGVQCNAGVTATVAASCSTNPTMDGCSCTSTTSSCGTTNTGTYSGGVCSATVPTCSAGNTCSLTSGTTNQPIGSSVSYAANPPEGGSYTWSSPQSGSSPLTITGATNNIAQRTFSSAGTYTLTVRGTDGNTISCPTVTVPAATPTCSLTANPSGTVPSTLTWSSTSATTCTGGGFSTGGATSGTASVSTAGSYTLSCTGAGGSCPVSAVTLAGGGGVCSGDSGLAITATPSRVAPGGTTQLTWNAGGVATTCKVTGTDGYDSGTLSPSACTVTNASGVSRTITNQTVYTLTCDGSVTKKVIVNLIPAFQEF